MSVASELELNLLRPPLRNMPQYPPKYITLPTGEKMVVREVKREEIPILLEVIEPLIHVTEDFYDLVGVRFYAELLGKYLYRVRDEYCLVGTVDGEIVGMVNGRMVDENVGMSYHTMAVKRGVRVGALLFASKMEHHIEFLNQQEVLIVAEGPIGFRRWMGEYQLQPRLDAQHELGGVPTYFLSRSRYFDVKDRLVAGVRPVPPELLATADKLIKPREYPQIPRWKPRWSQ